MEVAGDIPRERKRKNPAPNRLYSGISAVTGGERPDPLLSQNTSEEAGDEGKTEEDEGVQADYEMRSVFPGAEAVDQIQQDGEAETVSYSSYLYLRFSKRLFK